MISSSRLRQLYRYEPETGLFYRQISRGRWPAGTLAGTITNGYVELRIDSWRAYAHRLAFVYMEGRWPITVDHINRVRTDNRWVNLREVTNSQNKMNVERRVDNRTGVSGVFWTGYAYMAYITKNGKRVYLGNFETLEEAKLVRETAVREFFGEYGYIEA